MIPQHSSATVEHHSPPEVVEAARQLMGSIDLDPASCAKANETIKARYYYGQKQDGLACVWGSVVYPDQGWNVFLNPPGGLVDRRSGAAVWWDKLVREWESGRVKQAVFVGFTLEILRSTQAPWVRLPVQAFPRCYPAKRLKFGGNSPTHANVLVYLPPQESIIISTGAISSERFRKWCETFGALGLCEGGCGGA